MNAVGIDVSKRKSTVTIRQPGDKVILPPRDFRHTQSSINELIATIKSLEGETKVCMEHSGRYYEPVASWLSAAGIFVSAVNPLLIKEFGNESIRAPKTDKADAKKHAHVVFVGHGTYAPANATYSQMEHLFQHLGGPLFHVATIEGYPTLETLLADLKAHNLQKRTVALIENGTWAPTAGGLMREVLASMKDMKILSHMTKININSNKSC